MTTKQRVRFWFEYYKLALADPNLRDEIKRSAKFYEAWGDIRRVDFDAWWETHEHLFVGHVVEEITEVTRQPGALYVRVPLWQDMTATLAQIKVLVANAQRRQAAQGKGKADVRKLQHRTMHYSLILYRDIYVPAKKKTINAAFLESVRHHFFHNRDVVTAACAAIGAEFPDVLPENYEQRLHIKRNAMPSPLHNDEREAALRYLRRRIKEAEHLKLLAAKGKFPV